MQLSYKANYKIRFACTTLSDTSGINPPYRLDFEATIAVPTGIQDGMRPARFGILLLLLSTASAQTVPGSAAPAFRGMANGNVAAGELSPLTLQQSYGIGGHTTVLAAMVGWFGSSKHADIGYHSDDPAQVARQLGAMQARGIDGVTIAWYGSGDQGVSGRTPAVVMRQAEQMSGFSFALRAQGGMLRWYAKGQQPTAALIQQLRGGAQAFFDSPAYLKVDGRPVVLFFGFESFGIDWLRVKAAVPGNPLFLFRNSKDFDRPGSDGAFAWGPANGLSYLRYFYKSAAHHPGEIAVGDLHKGFNDSAASWGKNRLVDQRCGQTFLDTVSVLPSDLSFVQLVTWDDYEEGTELETGIDNCIRVDLQRTASGLEWSVTGNESAVDHYEVQTSQDGTSFTTVARLATGKHAYSGQLSGEMRVVAVGKALFIDQVSNTLAAQR